MAGAGYRLAPEEIERLLDQIDIGNTGMVAKSQLAASQVGGGRCCGGRGRWKGNSGKNRVF